MITNVILFLEIQLFYVNKLNILANEKTKNMSNLILLKTVSNDLSSQELATEHVSIIYSEKINDATQG